MFKFRPMTALLSGGVLTGFAIASDTASAASSGWFEMEGARIRLVTTGHPDASGKLKGILDIDLKPGWKTYWRDPGDAGVPPELDISASLNIASATIDFPAPRWHDEGDFQWAGYDHPVALPVTFHMRDPSARPEMEIGVFLGICETICVPLQARLTLDPAGDARNEADETVVETAFKALPPAATPGFGVRIADASDAADVVLEASFPGNPRTAQLFIAGQDGYVFSAPRREEREGRTIFTTNVTRPDERPEGAGLHYTLVTDTGAVSGLLPYF